MVDGWIVEIMVGRVISWSGRLRPRASVCPTQPFQNISHCMHKIKFYH